MQILQFRVQNFVFSCLPKAISNRRYSHIIPAHPCQCRFSNFVCKTWCFHAFLKPFQIEDMHIHYSCPPLPVQILQFRVQNLVFSCLPKAISNRRYAHILFLPTPASADCVQNLVFSCLPKAISNRRYSHILFLPTPASADSPISCAKLGVFMPSQSHFKQKIFTYIIPAHPCQCRFSNFVCKTWCFHAFPKPFQIEDIHIHYSSISCAKLCVFMPFQSFSNRRYSHTLFLPTPASADSPISCAKLGVFMPSQSHFK